MSKIARKRTISSSMPDKVCKVCGAAYSNTVGYSFERWAASKFCSRKCAWVGRNQRENAQSAFLTKFIPEPNSGCWIWEHGVGSHGYGLFALSGAKYTAHRFSYQYHCGEIPEGLNILHSCDNRLCVNPDHLRVGTQKDNATDSVVRGRTARGERSGSAKLGPSDVVKIRRCDDPSKALADELGITQATVNDIRARRSWKHLA